MIALLVILGLLCLRIDAFRSDNKVVELSQGSLNLGSEEVS